MGAEKKDVKEKLIFFIKREEKFFEKRNLESKYLNGHVMRFRC